MTTKSPAATIRDALLPGDPISLDEAVELTHASRQATVLALNHLTSRGDLALVRQRLWVRSGAAPDPYRLGARIAQPYAFVYGSALALNGAGSAERSEVLVSGPHPLQHLRVRRHALPLGTAVDRRGPRPRVRGR